MSIMWHIIKHDFKVVFRDSTLRVFLVLPVIIFLLILLLVPYIAGRYEAVAPYQRFILIASSVQMLQMFGFMYSMMLIDSKEIGVAKVYGIAPISKTRLLGTQLLFPFTATFVLTFLLFLCQQLVNYTILQSIFAALLVTSLLPLYILFVVTLSGNRVEGMVWLKTVNILLILPLLAFFLDSVVKYIFYLLPSYWLFQYLDSPSDFILALIFLVLNLILTSGFIRHFLNTQFR